MEVSALLHDLVTLAPGTQWIRDWVGLTGQCGCLGNQKKPVSPARNSNLICLAHNTIHAMLSYLLPNNFPQKCWYAFLILPIPAFVKLKHLHRFPYPNNTTYPDKSQYSLSCNIPNSTFTSGFLVIFLVHFMFFSNTHIMHFPRSKKPCFTPIPT